MNKSNHNSSTLPLKALPNSLIFIVLHLSLFLLKSALIARKREAMILTYLTYLTPPCIYACSYWPLSGRVCLYIFNQSFQIIYFFRGRGRGEKERKRQQCERQTLICGLLYVPAPGTEPATMQVPWPGIKPAAFHFAG